MRFAAAVVAVLAASSIADADGDWDPRGGPGIDLASNVALAALCEFEGHLYIGTENPGVGARIYRTTNGVSFTAVATAGFGDGVTKVTEFEVFGSFLYCGTASPAGGAIYRSDDGVTWTRVSPFGFGSADNAEVTALAEFAGDLYAGTRNTGAGGAQLWKSADGTTWTESVTTDGFGDADNTSINDLEVDGSFLFAVTTNDVDGGNYVRVTSGDAFTVLVDDGFGTDRNSAFTALEVYRGEMYIGTRNTSDGYEIWSTPDDLGYYRRLKEGGGDSANVAVADLERFGEYMYVGVESVGEAFEVLRTDDGGHYGQEDSDGFEDPGNFRANDFAQFGNKLWCGTSNPSGGGLYEASIPSGGKDSSSNDDDDDDDHRWRAHCFVATAAWGSTAVPRVERLRQVRDRRVEACDAGRRFTGLYRASAPPVARVVGGSELLRALVRRALPE